MVSDSHDVQGIVAEQATVTQSIPIISDAAAHMPDHNPADDPRRAQEQQQQVKSLRAGAMANASRSRDASADESAIRRSSRGVEG
jgi:hypothetical protein